MQMFPVLEQSECSPLHLTSVSLPAGVSLGIRGIHPFGSQSGYFIGRVERATLRSKLRISSHLGDVRGRYEKWPGPQGLNC